MPDTATEPRRTRVVAVDPSRPDPAAIREAARCLARGGLVAFPTETVYGLGADATNSRAVAAVFEAKGRPPDNPLIVHVAAPDDVRRLVLDVPDKAAALMRAFWPGPLSLVLPRSRVVAPEVSCGLDTVAVRMPNHPVALALIRAAGVPVAAPSANASGRPSPTRAGDVVADLGGRIDYVLDAGTCPVGVESTVLDLGGPVPAVLRPGGVTLEELRGVIGEVLAPAAPDAALPPSPGGVPPAALPRSPGGVPPAASPSMAGPARSPGLRHRHYAPRAGLTVVLPGRGGPGREPVARALGDLVRAELGRGRGVGLACTRETAAFLSRAGLLPGTREKLRRKFRIIEWGSRDQAAQVAARLFSALRDLDRMGVEVIVAEGLAPGGLGLAVNDRLTRGAEVVVDLDQPGSPRSGVGSGPEGAAPGPAGAANGARGTAAPEPETILVVCSGNTCRSPMGALILGDVLRRRGGGRREFRVESGGVRATDGQPASPEAVQVMAERGLDLKAHRSRQVTSEVLSGARLILTMTREQKEALLSLHPEVADRVHTFKGYAGTPDPDAGEDVADPIGLGLEAYRRAADEIERAAASAAERLLGAPDLAGLVAGGGPDEAGGGSGEAGGGPDRAGAGPEPDIGGEAGPEPGPGGPDKTGAGPGAGPGAAGKEPEK